MHTVESMSAALARANQIVANRRVVVAFISGPQTGWWGGDIDDWQPEEEKLTSQAALNAYRKLLVEFKAGRAPIAHAVMVYKDGTFASVMLGVKARAEAEAFLTEALGIAQIRSPYVWLKA
jgi:hypothetical protein